MCCGVVRILFGWFLRVPSLHALVFFWKMFCDLFLLFLLGIVLEMVREKRGGKGEDAHSVKYERIELCCSQRTKNHHKFKSFQVKL